jgi:hypothetical protein
LNRPPASGTRPTRISRFLKTGRDAGLIFVVLNLVVIGWSRTIPDHLPGDMAGNPGLSVKLNPSISMEEVRMEITRYADIRQIITAEKLDLDEADDNPDEADATAELDDMDVRFYENGKNTGELKAGKGRLWLRDRPEWGIARNDLYMKDDVYYRGSNGMTLETPYIYYTSLQSTLEGDGGYAMTYPFTNTSPWISLGQNFRITLDPESNTIEGYNLSGNPARLINTEKEPAQP